jgi:DNA-binding PadR family transcriptional regulator
MIKFILLGFLNYQPMTGYDLKQSIDSSTAHFWHAHHSQIYTTLRQMEQDGLATSEFIREEGQPNRRVYTIADAGRQELTAWLDQTLTEMSPIKEELLVRLFFSAQRYPQKVLAELLIQRQLHEAKAAEYNKMVAEMPGQRQQLPPSLAKDALFWRMTLEMGMDYEAMYLAWLDKTMKTIENL